jgi:aspartyl-tRNA(Asn)/glutamyl-tRNA(Gln) amidotransferase subunit C
MSLNKEQVIQIAKLGRLSLSEEEIEKYSKELNAILDYVETLNELDTENIEPMVGAVEFRHITRDDKVLKSSPEEREKLLENAPDRSATFIKVPQMLEQV